MELKFWQVPDEVWEIAESLIPARPARDRGGRPPIADRTIMEGLIFRLKTGCQWKAIPDRFGSGSTLHARFQEWTKAGVFRALFAAMVRYYDGQVGIDLVWCSLDSAIVKAPKGGTKLVPTPRIEPNAGQNAMC